MTFNDLTANKMMMMFDDYYDDDDNCRLGQGTWQGTMFEPFYMFGSKDESLRLKLRTMPCMANVQEEGH